MRRPLRLALALPGAITVLALSAAPAGAQQPPPATPAPPPPGKAIGDAGTALARVRVLPPAAPASTIQPDYAEQLPKQAAFEIGFGLSSAQVNSESFLAYERAIAQSAPGGIAIQGNSPQMPGSVAQTALPDNPQPTSFGLNLPPTPLDPLLKLGLLNGTAHARWSETLGPCVGTISDASTELASLSLFNAIPALPGITDISGRLTESKLDPAQQGALTDAIKQLAAPLSELGGVLTGPAEAKQDGNGSLISVPNVLASRSTVRLVDIPGSANKAVESTSTFQVARVNLFQGTPFALSIGVVSQPTLRVTATGDAKTSKVDYTAPVFEVRQGDKVLYRLDAARPTADIPIGIPLPSLAGQLPPELKNLPLVGDLANALPKNSPLAADAANLNKQKLDIGVLRLSIANLERNDHPLTQPFKGHQISAVARMLDLQVLPTDALGLPGLPSALAQVSLGEQIARAGAPEGGVVCGATAPAPAPQPRPAPGLAYTNAYQVVPVFWTGAAMLLVGVVLLVTVRPRRVVAVFKPTPYPRAENPTNTENKD
jgi:hypothetical protein